MILERINSELYWVIIAVLVVNMLQRKHIATGGKKRIATLILASLILGLNMLFALILSTGMPQWTALIALLIVIGIGYMLRNRLLLFRLHCASCGTKLDWQSILYHDDNLCGSCRKEHSPQPQAADRTEPAESNASPNSSPDTPKILSEQRETAAETADEYCIDHPEEARDVKNIDWDTWEPTETAVLCYIFKDGKVLLINKKTGLGKGMVNAPGGRIEEAETALEAAVRETQEETGITPLHLEHVGILNFQFVDGYGLRGYIFFADDCSGTMTETFEAEPFWVSEDAIPYEQMWADDRDWLPEAMNGQFVLGQFIFDGKEMLSSRLQVRSRKNAASDETSDGTSDETDDA